MAFDLIPSKPFCITGGSVRNYCKGVLLPTLILAKKMWLTFKITCCTFVFLQILLAWRLFRSFLTHYFVKLSLAVSVYYNANVGLFNDLNNKLFSYEYWIMIDYEKTRKILRWQSMLELNKIDSFISIG